MAQTNCARCLLPLRHRELLRESLLCMECEQHLLEYGAQNDDLCAGLFEDEGARHILATHRDELKLIRCTDPGALRDIDVPEDPAA